MGDRAIKHYVCRARLRQSRQRRVAAAEHGPGPRDGRGITATGSLVRPAARRPILHFESMATK
jgi:hypothetical protein